MTAHVTALYPGFFAAALAAGCRRSLAALPLAYFSNLNAAMTHYGTGSAPVYFNAGYVRQADWWRVGFLISLLQSCDLARHRHDVVEGDRAVVSGGRRRFVRGRGPGAGGRGQGRFAAGARCLVEGDRATGERTASAFPAGAPGRRFAPGSGTPAKVTALGWAGRRLRAPRGGRRRGAGGRAVAASRRERDGLVEGDRAVVSGWRRRFTPGARVALCAGERHVLVEGDPAVVGGWRRRFTPGPGAGWRVAAGSAVARWKVISKTPNE